MTKYVHLNDHALRSEIALYIHLDFLLTALKDNLTFGQPRQFRKPTSAERTQAVSVVNTRTGDVIQLFAVRPESLHLSALFACVITIVSKHYLTDDDCSAYFTTTTVHVYR